MDRPVACTAGGRYELPTGAAWMPGRTLLVPDPGPAWPQVVGSLLDGWEFGLLRPPLAGHRPGAAAPLRRRRGAGVGVLLVAGR